MCPGWRDRCRGTAGQRRGCGSVPLALHGIEQRFVMAGPSPQNGIGGGQRRPRREGGGDQMESVRRPRAALRQGAAGSFRPLKQTFSDHLPVVSRFYLTDGGTQGKSRHPTYYRRRLREGPRGAHGARREGSAAQATGQPSSMREPQRIEERPAHSRETILGMIKALAMMRRNAS